MGEYSAKNQYLATFVVNLYIFGFGIFQSWSVGEYIAYHMLSAFYSEFIQFGQFIGYILFGFITMKFGRKKPLMYISIPMIISCLINLCTRKSYCFHGSMFLAGVFGGGVQVLALFYILEIANERFRGAMLVSTVLSSVLGQILGSNLAFDGFLVVVIFSSVIPAIAFYFLPETPLFFVNKNELQKAEESIRFYKNIPKTDAYQLETLEELAKLKNAVAYNGMEAIQMNPFRWADFKSEHAKKALKVGIVLVALLACDTTIHSTSRILYTIHYNNESFLTPERTVTIASIINILTIALTMQLCDHVGRKILVIASAIGLSLTYLIYGICTLLNFYPYSAYTFGWIPAITYILLNLFGSLGVHSLTFGIIVEIMPQKIKDMGIPILLALCWILLLVLKTCADIAIDFGCEYLWMFVSTGVCSAGAIFIHLKMPETKGKNHQEIMKSL